MQQFINVISTWIVPVLISVTMHEAAHGYAANLLGDDTAKKLGRVTLNPFKHIDRFGTVILPLLLILMKSPFIFGWAKPVPVMFHRLKNPLRDMVIVAIAGPLTNIALAIISASILSMMQNLSLLDNLWLVRTLINFIFINIILAVFNMIPIPPLDGGRVAVGLLPKYFSYQLAKLERYGLFIIIGALFILPLLGKQIGIPLEPIHWFIQYVSNFLLTIISFLTGLNI
ncbi:MAG: site-2 protease family protein [Pelagibacteraceae bacterium]|jgi:Zn-dependent protease|nr:site-2 protease family protein [Pelagibacteraceae bacterium]